MTLSGSGGEQFRGFLVQARTVADGTPVGTFIDNGDDQTLSSCNSSEVGLCIYSISMFYQNCVVRKISMFTMQHGLHCMNYVIYTHV